MSHFRELNRLIEETIHKGRIGQPVFVRCHLSTEADHTGRQRALLKLVSAIEQWLGDSIIRLHAIEPPARGEIVTCLQFRRGGTALVSTMRSTDAGAGVDVMVLGNHGAVYQEGRVGIEQAQDTDESEQGPSRVLAAALEAALKSGRPQDVRGGEGR